MNTPNNKNTSHAATVPRKPPWLKKKIRAGHGYTAVKSVLKDGGLNTVCSEAGCPNLGECFDMGTATFLILGDTCTRSCRFCAVGGGALSPPDAGEPDRVAQAVARLKLSYAVITSVTRDDLSDGGSMHFADMVAAVRRAVPDIRIELLIPDFGGSKAALDTVLKSGPDVLAHNIETVPRLYELARSGADYKRSLELLHRIRQSGSDVLTKSGIMLGMGESDEEIRATLCDLLDYGCEILTIGQYLQPTKAHLPVERYVTPGEFESWRITALKMGFRAVVSGPFVRSSYKADELYKVVKKQARCCQEAPLSEGRKVKNVHSQVPPDRGDVT